MRLGCEVTVVIGASGKIMGKEDDDAADLVTWCMVYILMFGIILNAHFLKTS